MKRVERSALARSDIQLALDDYLDEAPHAAARFITALEKATAQISRQPGIGSPRYALELQIPGLRHWRLNRFPYTLFYMEHDDHLDLIRLVHMARDIPATLQSDEPT
jgi:toxin ParE1/3/4